MSIGNGCLSSPASADREIADQRSSAVGGILLVPNEVLRRPNLEKSAIFHRVRERLFVFGSREAVAEPVAGERSGVQIGGALPPFPTTRKSAILAAIVRVVRRRRPQV
jgi:hypothetical protein